MADIGLSYLVTTFGSPTISQYFDDDGDGAPDAAIVEEFCELATATAQDALVGFDESINESVRSHPRYKRLVAIIALGERTMSRQAWMLPDGSWPYEKQKREALASLAAIGAGLARMRVKNTPDANPHMQSARRPAERELIYAPSSKNPTGPGSF